MTLLKRFPLILFAGLCAYLASGLYFVQPDEVAVVRRCGKALPITRGPGAHFGLPWAWDRVDRIKLRAVRRVTIGPVNLGAAAVGADPAQYLTGDRNLVNIQATVQYTVHDPVQYLFQTERPQAVLGQAGGAALSQILASQPVDRAMTSGKQEVSIRTRQRLQSLADQYQLGVRIRSVDLSQIQPPAEVADAFDKVISALRQRDQQMHEAQSYANRLREEAPAEAQRIRDDALAYRGNTVRQAEGQAERFEKLLVQYERSPSLTAQRLYLEAMAQTLPNLQSKLIMDEDSQLDLSLFGNESP